MKFFSTALLLLLVLATATGLISADDSALTGTRCTVPTQRVDCQHLTCLLKENHTFYRCHHCTADDQCWEPAMECRQVKARIPENKGGGYKMRGECHLQPIDRLFDTRPLGVSLAAAMVLVVCAIAVIAGTGGGGILTPLYAVTLGVPLNHAVALSQVAIVGQSLYNVILKVREHHPSKTGPKRPLVNYTLLAFWLPISLVGILWGGIAGDVMPDWCRMLLLFTILSYALKRTVDRMLDQRARDKEEKDAKKARREAVVLELAQLREEQERVKRAWDEKVAAGGGDDDQQQQQQQGGESDEQQERELHESPATPDNKKQDDDDADPKKTPEQHHPVVAVEPVAPSPDAVPAAKRPESSTSGVSSFLADFQRPKFGDAVINTPMSPMSPVNIPPPSANAGEGEGASSEVAAPATKPPREVLTQFPRLQLAVIFLAVYAPFLLANVARNFWADCGSGAYWAIVFGITAYLFAVFLVYRWHLSKLHDQIMRTGGEVDAPKAHEIPFKWNDKTTILFPLLSVTAGMAASIVGLGGGLILNLLLLEAGLQAQETSATGGFATFVVASGTLLQFTFSGVVHFDYFVVFFAAGLLSTVLGQQVIMPEIKRRGWNFLIVGCLAFIMAGSIIATSAVGIISTVSVLQNGGDIGFGDLCVGDDD